eukprot:gb/GECH01009414.1/.p1 GENE.gb/GECH01009414.1/~~gb/GECH01009414.1/.p1  ORF type:complete len:125 (+),score=6.53 gb/GECH01009414.1/:1-375(+)
MATRTEKEIPETIRQLIDGKTQNLEHQLNLKFKEIGNEGCKYLTLKLKHYSSLTHLNLGGNKIGDEGAQHIAEVLKHSSCLTYLALWINRISDKGIQHIAEALKYNPCLTYLNLAELILRELNV